MSHYQVLARRYRPQKFQEVLGQDSAVTTLKNAIKHKRIAHAYLFCGSRGTGKTTLARIFAKAMNCQKIGLDLEPCNECSSCKEITLSSSLDVLEIDGASNRGIDDIRQINETVGYAASGGKYKIYIIDEVHMLTKEAFNALLKTLEEPPAKVKFIFATTEPHKLPPTILSRCQRFNLNRISNQIICKKLLFIAQDLNIAIEDDALHMIANMSEGALRDAESLFDQVLAFNEGKITQESVSQILGIMTKECFFELDKAGKEHNYAMAFEVSQTVFSQGKDLLHFLNSLIEHFRTILLVKLSNQHLLTSSMTSKEISKYEETARLYTQEQCMTILEYLIEKENTLKFSLAPRITLESILLHILRIHSRLPIEYLVKKLHELEQTITNTSSERNESEKKTPLSSTLEVTHQTFPEPAKKILDNVKRTKPSPSLVEDPTPEDKDFIQYPSLPQKSTFPKSDAPLTEDIISQPLDLSSQKKNNFQKEDLFQMVKEEKVIAQPTIPSPSLDAAVPRKNYDTLLQFASVELEGILQKKQNKRF